MIFMVIGKYVITSKSRWICGTHRDKRPHNHAILSEEDLWDPPFCVYFITIMSLPPRLRGHSVALNNMESTSEPSTTSSLKRTRSPVLDAPPEELPVLPKLSGHILLEVFTHKSLRLACNAPFRDNERLSVLGREILEMMTTQLLFFRKPKLTVHQIEVSRSYSHYLSSFFYS